MKFIVTAGGSGTKLWPLSKQAKPKQFQNMLGEKSLIQNVVNALLAGYPAQDIFISTKPQYLGIAKRQLPEVLEENYILEPEAQKNRGPAEGLAFAFLAEKFPAEPFMIIQSDVVFGPLPKFQEFIKVASELVTTQRKFLAGGIKATVPTLGVDYLRLGDRYMDSQLAREAKVYLVDEFLPRVKDLQLTRELISDFNVATHSNYNCWYPELMLEVYRSHRPDWFDALQKMRGMLGKQERWSELQQIYETMEPGPTEEVTKHIFASGYVILLPFNWTDMGTWASMHDYLGGENNYSDGELIAINSGGNLVKTSRRKLVALLGVDDLVVVDTDDCLMVVPRNRAGQVSEILAQIKAEGMTEYL